MPYKDPQKKKEYDRWYTQHKRDKEKEKLRSRTFRKNHPEKARATKKKYYLNGGYQILQNWRKNNPDKIREYNLRWIEKNKETIREKKKLWKKNNPDKVKAWNDENREKVNEYSRKWRNNVANRISHRIGGQIYESLKEKKEGKHWEDLLNYNLKDLVIHLENRFNDKMTWNNYGSYWVIDHIIPKSWFDFTSVEDKEFKECWALDNLQPLPLRENNSKKDLFSGTFNNIISRKIK